MSDLAALFSAQEEVRRWRAERENASARLDLARARECRAILMSQHEPLHSLGIDRKVMGVLLAFTVHHDESRMKRDLAALSSESAPIRG